METKEFIIITMDVSDIKRMLLMDVGVGTLSYYAIRTMTGNFLIDLLGSVIITESIKRFYKKNAFNNENSSKKLARI